MATGGIETGANNTNPGDIIKDIIPEQATTGVPQVTANANTGYGFYDKDGRIANPDTAQEIANATIAKEEELLQQHKEMANETEKLKGGYLEVIKPVVEKYPNLFDIKYDSDGEPVVISNLIEGVTRTNGFVLNVRAIIFFKEGVARITSDRPLIQKERENLQSISPEILKQWKQIFSDSGSDEIYGLDPKFLTAGFHHYGNMSLQRIEGSNIKDPLKVLIQERNTRKAKEPNADVIASLKKELSDL